MQLRAVRGPGRAAILLALVGPGVLFSAGDRAAAQEIPVPVCGSAVHVGETLGFVVLPTGELFCPLVGDPKAEVSFLSIARGDFPSITDPEARTDLGSVGLAESFPFGRWGGREAGNGIQVGLSAGIFAQFDLGSASFDLINADYLIGLPVTARFGSFSLRLRPYHQSSHLGDEFLLREGDVQRENLSFESLELILSQEMGVLRLYGGGEYLFRREPDALEPMLAHAGAELRLGPPRGARFLATLDAKSSQQQDWDPALSARAGFEVALWRDPGHPPRLWRVLLEFYVGPSPYGQFFQDQIRYVAIGFHISP
jgi:hypothetical protein